MSTAFRPMPGEVTVDLTERPAETDVAAVVRSAQMEMRALLLRRSEISKRIAVLRKTLRLVMGAEQDGDSVVPAPRVRSRKCAGINDACRMVLKQATKPLTCREITEAIRVSRRAEITHHPNLSAAVTRALSHLLASGEANKSIGRAARGPRGQGCSGQAGVVGRPALWWSMIPTAISSFSTPTESATCNRVAT